MLVRMQQGPRRVARGLGVIGGWVAVAAVATAVTLGAVSMIDLGLFGGSTRPLSEADVNEALAEAAASATPSTSTPPSTSIPPSPSPNATATATPSAPASQPPTQPAMTGPVPFSASGNSVLARCVGDTVEIISWTAAQGYRVDNGANQQGREAEVEFESDNSDVKIRVSCASGVPTAEVKQDG